MAIGVVHILKTIKVTKQHGNPGGVTLQMLERSLNVTRETAPVRQASHGAGHHLLGQRQLLISQLSRLQLQGLEGFPIAHVTEAEHEGNWLLRLHGPPLQFQCLERLLLQDQGDHAALGLPLKQSNEADGHIPDQPGSQQPIQLAAEHLQPRPFQQLLKACVAPEQSTVGIGNHQRITDLGQSQFKASKATP